MKSIAIFVLKIFFFEEKDAVQNFHEGQDWVQKIMYVTTDNAKKNVWEWWIAEMCIEKNAK